MFHKMLPDQKSTSVDVIQALQTSGVGDEAVIKHLLSSLYTLQYLSDRIIRHRSVADVNAPADEFYDGSDFLPLADNTIIKLSTACAYAMTGLKQVIDAHDESVADHRIVAALSIPYIARNPDAVAYIKRYQCSHPTKDIVDNDDAKEYVLKYGPKVEKICSEESKAIEKRCLVAAQVFTHAFLTTLLEKYVRPYLINQYHEPQKVTWAMELLKSAVTLGLNGSLLNTALSTIITNGLKPALRKIGVDVDTVDKIVTEIGTIVAFAKNPLSLVELGVNSLIAAEGQAAAYALIHVLPKLKDEPILPLYVAQADKISAPGLRRRAGNDE